MALKSDVKETMVMYIMKWAALVVDRVNWKLDDKVWLELYQIYAESRATHAQAMR